MDNAPMNDADRRKTILRAYLRGECGGNQAELARRIGRKPSYVSDLLSPTMGKSFGDKAARLIEKKLKKHRGWLDGMLSVEEAGSAREVARLLGTLEPERFYLWVDELIAAWRASRQKQ